MLSSPGIFSSLPLTAQRLYYGNHLWTPQGSVEDSTVAMELSLLPHAHHWTELLRLSPWCSCDRGRSNAEVCDLCTCWGTDPASAELGPSRLILPTTLGQMLFCDTTSQTPMAAISKYSPPRVYMILPCMTTPLVSSLVNMMLPCMPCLYSPLRVYMTVPCVALPLVTALLGEFG